MRRFGTCIFFGVFLLACRGQEPSSKPQALGLQDCGSPWVAQLCPVFGRMDLSPDMQQFKSAQLGPFTIQWDGRQLKEARLHVRHARNTEHDRWASLPGRTFVASAQGVETIEENRGSIRFSDQWKTYCKDQKLERWTATSDVVRIEGSFAEKECPQTWTLQFSLEDAERLAFDLKTSHPETFNRTFLTYASRAEEQFFGFGMQFSHFNLKGRRLPIVSQEQGVGRGAQPISIGAEITNGAGVAGDWWTSYASVPHYMSSDMRSLFLENSEISFFDMRDKQHVRIEVLSHQLKGQILEGRSPQELLEVYTRYAGRMQPLPQWMDQGAIVGLQGGSARVQTLYQELRAAGVPISALWLQDWVGKRQTSFGSQLWWNWELDREQYGDWPRLQADLAKDKVALLSYFNPFLTDPTGKAGLQRNLFQEALDQGLLVQNQEGAPYLIQNTSFAAGLLDISQPAARTWIKDLMKDTISQTKVKGWMADFGEALPFDSRLKNANASRYHNVYPEEWARLNREALEEAGVWDDALIFSRSAFTRSPGITRLFWLGDQLVSWDEHDGMKTALVGLLSSGLSGFSLNHSDTGGYTTITNPIRNYHRSAELFQRWTEMNAFTAVLRTHEGNQPENNHQVYSDAATLQHFSRFARIYTELAPYRRQLMEEAARTGMPLVRSMFLQFPWDAEARELDRQFLLGDQLLIAPVLDPGKDKVKVYIPEEGWVHLASGKAYAKGWHTIPAPIGQPAVFASPSSPVNGLSRFASLAALLQN